MMMTTGNTADAASHASTAALCACSLINAYLMIGVFPYAGYMAMALLAGVTQDNAGTYAGLIASSFMVGRTLSAYMWGKAADIYGRIFVLNSCLLLSAAFSLLFCTAGSFRGALFWRFCLGFSNGIISTAKTAATELADGNHVEEKRNMFLVIGMRSWGYLVTPSLCGLLSDPIRQYPGASWLRQGWIGHVLTKYPFLLPNLVACVACLVTFVVVTFFVHETLPESKRRDASNIPGDLLNWIQNSLKSLLHSVNRHVESTEQSQICPFRGRSESRILLTASYKYGTTREAMDGSTFSFNGEPTESVWERMHTRHYLLVHWMFSFVSMCADVLFPLFCMSQTGGLGLTEASIGKILSGAGLLFALSQYTIFSTLIHHYGEYTCLTIGSVLGIQPSTFIPLSLLLGTSSESSWMLFALLSIIMAICKLFGLLYFTSLALTLNKTVPSSQRGTMNGLVVSGASLTRAIAPTFAGALSSFCYSSSAFPSEYGSVLVYGTLSMLAALITLRVRHLNDAPDDANTKEATLEIEDLAPLRKHIEK